jgi:hypothetical protein
VLRLCEPGVVNVRDEMRDARVVPLPFVVFGVFVPRLLKIIPYARTSLSVNSRAHSSRAVESSRAAASVLSDRGLDSST